MHCRMRWITSPWRRERTLCRSCNWLRALKRGQASAAVQCTMGKAKILGLIIDRREVGDVGRFDGFTDEQLVEEAARLARSLGLAGPRLVADLRGACPPANALDKEGTHDD